MKNILTFALILIVGAISIATAHAGVAGAVIMAGVAVMPRDRALFNKLVTDYKGNTPSPSYLRVEQTLTNSKGVYEFKFKRTDNEADTEVKLDQGDIFVITHLAVYLLKEDSTKIGIGVLQSFVNQQVFASATGFTPSHLESIYSGKLQLKVGQEIKIESLSMQEFRYVPTTQQSSATNLSEYNAKDAKYTPDMLITLSGKRDNTVTITFPTFASMAIAAVANNTKNKLVLHPYGYLIRNAAQ
jgi:hypothetical protein